MTYFVYILYSEKDHKLYTGSTNDIERRVKQHNDGHVTTTKSRRPLTLIYTEKCETRKKAHQREYFLKTKWGNTFKQRVRRYYINKIRHESDR